MRATPPMSRSVKGSVPTFGFVGGLLFLACRAAVGEPVGMHARPVLLLERFGFGHLARVEPESLDPLGLFLGEPDPFVLRVEMITHEAAVDERSAVDVEHVDAGEALVVLDLIEPDLL